MYILYKSGAAKEEGDEDKNKDDATALPARKIQPLLFPEKLFSRNIGLRE